eukprot:TRINITY_DN2146_c0_g1_i1.p1 TRINITY_DN2146_c0_g1~~TRINITY_DN2146_c0_g1_i1.p1  ORF type:complete len:174 (+),score=41.10 TRINITY_DN2146_c0_g1_i1:189-710(+)
MGAGCCRGVAIEDSDDEDYDPNNLLEGPRTEDTDALDRELLKHARMPKVFLEMDDNNSGLIEYPEFLRGFGMDDSPLVQKMFYIFDEDNSGNLDFYELIKLIDQYRRMSYDERVEWCFQVYDQDGSGFIDKAEFHSMLTDMNYQVRSPAATHAMILKIGRVYEEQFGVGILER